MDRRAHRFGGVGGHHRQLRTQGMCEGDMRDEATAKKRTDTSFCSIKKLVGYEDLLRTVFMFQAADGARRQDSLHAEHLESEYVGAEIQLGRQDPMSSAVTSEEGDALAAKRTDQVRPGGIAEWRRDRAF